MRSTKTLAPVGLLVACLTLAAACGGEATSGALPPSETIEIAYAGPMTGPASQYGIDQFEGVKLAVDKINADGGITSDHFDGAAVSVKSYDDKGDPNQAASIAQKLCDSDVAAVLGHVNSAATLAAIPVYARCGMPVINSYSSAPDVTRQGHENVFRTIVDGPAAARSLATSAKEKLNWSRVGVIYSQDEYGTSLYEAFKPAIEDIGGTIVREVKTTPGQVDFTPQLTQLKGEEIDGIILLSVYSDAAVQLKQARQIGLETEVLASSANTPGFIDLAGEASEGAYVNAYVNVFESGGPIVGFRTDFVDAFDRDPAESSALAYDAVFLIQQALENGGDSREGIIEAASAGTTFELPLTGALTFNFYHEPDMDKGAGAMSLMVVKDGTFESVED